MLIKRELCIIFLTTEHVEVQKNEFASLLYSLVFSWIVKYTNIKLCKTEEETANFINFRGTTTADEGDLFQLLNGKNLLTIMDSECNRSKPDIKRLLNSKEKCKEFAKNFNGTDKEFAIGSFKMFIAEKQWKTLGEGEIGSLFDDIEENCSLESKSESQLDLETLQSDEGFELIIL
ncbi:hypothetical protein H8356DRAFT_1271259 [Neocallimastix lanati (nom. inval.)]|nr:hypothetical protein H8356DRAFT_1271259 [Neocallimastix sp. JGI-2020a]